LKGESFSATFKVDSKVITSHNIVGRIEGSKHPDQTVIYSAHWDHLGVGQPDAKGDRIYNGAVDNATGTAALIELASSLCQAPKPERSVVFLNVTAEEKGLLGSEYYAAKPLYPLATTVGVINMDALDPHGPSRNFTISGSAKLGLLDDLIADAKKFGMVYSPDPKPEAGTSSAPITSRSPSAACRRSPSARVMTGSMAASPPARRPKTTTPPNATTSRATSGRPTGRSPAWPAICRCSMCWEASWPTPTSGRTGARTPSSAPPGTRQQPIASSR
jgi:hypothetical protein